MQGVRAPADALSFRRDVNGLRAFAVASVVAFHVDRDAVPGGFVGVDIFFVISGYLISRIIFAELSAGEFSLREFYAKRIRRIFPALIVVLFAVWIAGWFLLDPPAFTELGRQERDGAFFSLNFRQIVEPGYFDLASAARPLLHLWSLSIEEQFYIVWPALLLLLFRFRRAVAPAIFVILFASLTANLALTEHDPTKAFYLPWTRAWELALGASVGYRELFWRVEAGRGGSPIAEASVLAGLGLMIGAVFLLSDTQPFPGWRALAPTFGCALVLANPDADLGTRLLGGRLAQGLGKISYPLYLWHWPLLSFAFIEWGQASALPIRVALAALAIVLAWLTYRWVERPAALSFRLHEAGVVAALAVALIGCGAVGSLTKSLNGFTLRYPARIEALFDYPPRGLAEALYRSGQCFYDKRDTPDSLKTLRARLTQQFSAAGCATVKDASKPTILILGDSHGAHLYPGLEAEFGAAANVLQLNANYCAPLIEPASTGEGETGTKRCRIIMQLIQEKVREIKPAVIVVGAFYMQYLNFPAYRYPDFANAFRGALADLRATGAGPVIVAGDPPIWRPTLPSLVARELLATGRSSEYSRVGLASEALAIDDDLRRQQWPTGVTYVSLDRGMCIASGCLRRVGDDLPGDLTALDYGHLSRQGSIFVARNVLGPAIRAALQSERP
ncbi:MAG TPA: acyltransferase family protein [Roseiarcus sp.]|jgi:peptidoglycan/LPS O-acetylase OafA/YrhL